MKNKKMKNKKSVYSGIIVGTLLVICGIGLLLLHGGTSVTSINAVQYNAVPTWE